MRMFCPPDAGKMPARREGETPSPRGERIDMNNAMMSGVSGLKAHQTMIDVTGNNLANMNTTAFKASRVSFGELLSQTLREASSGSSYSGGTNAMQVGYGVGVLAIERNMTQGSLTHTGVPLDMAISGAGYFVLNDGQKDVFTRVGAFTVDENYYLVDPSTGYHVQRIGAEGVAEGFQNVANSNIRIPYDTALPAKVTENISFTGSLAADDYKATTNLLTSVVQYTQGAAVTSPATRLADLDQVSGGPLNGTITITGTDRAGNAVSSTLTVDATTTMGDLVDAISAAFPGSTAKLTNGEIRLKDDDAGYSLTDMKLSYAGTGTIELPTYFKVLEAGGQCSKTVNVTVYDTQGVGHVLSAEFVRTNVMNQWDLVITSISGDVQLVDRRIEGIKFLNDGSFGGVGVGANPDKPIFQMIFANDPGTTREITIDFGSVGEFNGVQQFGGASTVAASGQDGYACGNLTSLSVNPEGVLVGTFSNGIRKNIACLKIATFQNPAGLTALGGNYYLPSANSGDMTPVRALSGGAGSVSGGSLERSNVEVAGEFVNLILAQNGFQANARTISVANDMIREVSNLLR
ncbi:MAG: flagellar hook-basal body complex protein [Phycisphaerae bacterium]|nr:flagellar hook-basal body complex protein [Phycisphaerae bacterium]